MLLNRVVYLLMIIAVADGNDVLKLTDKNFDTLMAENQLVLVNFYTAKYVTAVSISVSVVIKLGSVAV